MLSQKHSAKYVCRTGTSASSTARAGTSCEMERKQEVYLVRVESLLYPELLHQEGPSTRSQEREERRLQRIPHGKTTSKEVSKETLRKHPRPIHPRQVIQKDDDRVGSL